jgi:hypothetical protein
MYYSTGLEFGVFLWWSDLFFAWLFIVVLLTFMRDGMKVQLMLDEFKIKYEKDNIKLA